MEAAKDLLEIAPVATIHGGDALYAVSYSAIRSVAAGGKVCLIALDPKGAEALCKDDRIDAAFVYVTPPSLDELEARIRGRLKEAKSTIAKRVAWAKQQVRLQLRLVRFCSIYPCVSWDINNSSLAHSLADIS
jgi:guanylate kinase